MSGVPELCNDHGQGAPGCVGLADPRYTMDFTDVRPGAYIYWCRSCGPRAHAMTEALDKAFRERPGFAKELESAINKARGGES